MPYWFDVPGPELAIVTRVTGWRSQTDDIGDFTPQNLNTINYLLAHEGGSQDFRGEILMDGSYEVEFGMSHFVLPPTDEVRWTYGWWVEAVLFYRTTDLAASRAAEIAYDPIPSNATMNSRVRFSRAIGGVHLTWSADDNSAEGIIQVPNLHVSRLGGRVYGWRDWWDPCELD